MRFTDVAGVSRILKEHHESVCIAGSGVGCGRVEDDRRFFFCADDGTGKSKGSADRPEF